MARLRIHSEKMGMKQIVLKDHTLKIFFDEEWIESFSTPELLSNHLRSMIDSSPIPIHFIQEKEFGLRMKIQDEEPLSYIKKLLQSWG